MIQFDATSNIWSFQINLGTPAKLSSVPKHLTKVGFSHTTRTPGPTHQLREVLVVEIPFFTGFFVYIPNGGGGCGVFGMTLNHQQYHSITSTGNVQNFSKKIPMSFRLHPLLLGVLPLLLADPHYQAYGQRWRAPAQGVGVAPGLCWFGDVGGSGGEEAEG